MPATFSVPARLPRSCAPPSMMLTSGIFFFAYSTPTPLGAWNLWPDIESMSMFIASTSMGVWPAACTASVWKGMPLSRQSAPISAMGCTVPISLLANITVTRQVSGRIAASTSSRRTTPSSWTSSSVTSKPSFCSFESVCSTAWCSNFVEIRCFLPLRAPTRAADTMAWLSASLPPEVK